MLGAKPLPLPFSDLPKILMYKYLHPIVIFQPAHGVSPSLDRSYTDPEPFLVLR